MVPVSAARSTPVRSAAREIHRVDDGCGSVDGERSRDLCQVDVGEQGRHLTDTEQRNTDLADLGEGHGVVGVIPALRREIEGHRKTGLALFQQEAKPFVRLLGCTESGVLTHRPQAASVSIGEDPSRVGILSRVRDHMVGPRAGHEGYLDPRRQLYGSGHGVLPTHFLLRLKNRSKAVQWSSCTQFFANRVISIFSNSARFPPILAAVANAL